MTPQATTVKITPKNLNKGDAVDRSFLHMHREKITQQNSTPT